MERFSRVVVGEGKGTTLSSHVVYDVAHRIALVEIDPSTLDRLSQSLSRSPPLLPPPDTRYKGKLMSKPEARATLFVLLNKLVAQSQARIRPFIPIFLAEILNQFIDLDLPLLEGNSGVSLAVVNAIYRFRKIFENLDVGETDKSLSEERSIRSSILEPSESGVESTLKRLKFRLLEARAGEPGVTKEELDALEDIVAAGPGIAALSIHLSSSICLVSDTIASLSCEALQANTEAFESEIYSEGVSYKTESDVASDLRALLFGSKLVNPRKGGIEGEYISSIPFTHAGLREDIKLASNRARIEIINTGLSKKKSSVVRSPSLSLEASSSPLAKSVLSVILDFQSVASYSFGRLTHSLTAIRDVDTITAGVVKNESALLKFEEVCQNCLETLKRTISEAVCKFPQKEYSGVIFSSEAYTAVQEARKVLTLEAVVALALLDIQERLLIGKATVEKVGANDPSTKELGSSDNVNPQNGSCSETSTAFKGVKGKQGSEKKKKKKGGQEMILGRGTGFVRQRFTELLQRTSDDDHFLSFFGWADAIEEFLDPKNADFQSFLDGVKAVLESNDARRLPQVPKGTRDFSPEQMAIREKAFGIIASVFKRHGAVAIDTPVFELRETLMGKYGEDSKLIFDLADQGGQICSLRYDLTVPFARYVAMNSLSNMKRYHIARVYRRDNPSKGRYREFYQCDFDIAGHYASMVPDFEVIEVLTELLDELDIGDYQIKLNHRGLLDGMLDICGVPKGKFRTICSAIDKLDKLPWELVRKEMVEEKGLTGEIADKIGEFLKQTGAPLELLAKLKPPGSPFLEHEGSSHALEELATLFGYLQAANCMHRVVFDLSLARGLDYYTGVIYEAVFVGSTQVGSIAAGGRYDNLVGMFSGKQVPAVGVSLGIERVFAIMEQKVNDLKQVVRATQTEVLVIVLGEDIHLAIKLVKELWAGKIKAEFVCVGPRKFQKQMEYALDKGIPWMIIVGNDELEKGVVRLQNLATKQRDDIPRSDLVGELQKRLGFTCRTEFHPVFQ